MYHAVDCARLGVPKLTRIGVNPHVAEPQDLRPRTERSLIWVQRNWTNSVGHTPLCRPQILHLSIYETTLLEASSTTRSVAALLGLIAALAPNSSEAFIKALEPCKYDKRMILEQLR